MGAEKTIYAQVWRPDYMMWGCGLVLPAVSEKPTQEFSHSSLRPA